MNLAIESDDHLRKTIRSLFRTLGLLSVSVIVVMSCFTLQADIGPNTEISRGEENDSAWIANSDRIRYLVTKIGWACRG